jgi:hypothetical protein
MNSNLVDNTAGTPRIADALALPTVVAQPRKFQLIVNTDFKHLLVSGDAESAKQNPIREWPPADGSVPRGTNWRKDTADMVYGLDRAYPKYKWRALSAYGSGEYTTWSNSINYFGMLNYEFPPSGAFDKTDMYSSSGSGWQTLYTNNVNPQRIFISLPDSIYLTAYKIEPTVYIAGAYSPMPSIWTISGSFDCQNWVPLDVRSNITDWALKTPKMFNLTVPAPDVYSCYLFETFNMTNMGEFRLYGSKLNDWDTTETKYPSGPLSLGSPFISNNTYGMGSYQMMASSQMSPNTGPEKAFDLQPTIWESYQTYEYGQYRGAVSTEMVDGSSYYGEWIQVCLPPTIQLKVTDFSLFNSATAKTAPVVFALAASNSNTSSLWTLLRATNTQNWDLNADTQLYFQIPNAAPFSCFRFIAMSLTGIWPANGMASAKIGEFMLFGNEVAVEQTAAALKAKGNRVLEWPPDDGRIRMGSYWQNTSSIARMTVSGSLLGYGNGEAFIFINYLSILRRLFGLD